MMMKLIVLMCFCAVLASAYGGGYGGHGGHGGFGGFGGAGFGGGFESVKGQQKGQVKESPKQQMMEKTPQKMQEKPAQKQQQQIQQPQQMQESPQQPQQPQSQSQQSLQPQQMHMQQNQPQQPPQQSQPQQTQPKQVKSESEESAVKLEIKQLKHTIIPFEKDEAPKDKHVISRGKIQELLQQIESGERADPEAEELLIRISDEFVDYVVDAASKLAKHRGATAIEPKDVLLHLEKEWKIFLPDSYMGTIPVEQRVGLKRTASTPLQAHTNRVAAVKKTKTTNTTTTTVSK